MANVAVRNGGVPVVYDRDAASVVDDVVSLKGVQLVQSNFFLADDGPLAEPPAFGDAQVTFSAEWDYDDETRRFGVVTWLRCVPDTGDYPIYEISAAFRVRYTIEGAEPSADQLSQFAWWHVRPTIWPYWREHVDMLASRADVDAPIMPNVGLPKHGATLEVAD